MATETEGLLKGNLDKTGGIQMINYITDIKVEVKSTVEEFRKEVVSTIDFAVRDKEYKIGSFNADFIAEDITGIMGEHGMSQEALVIIEEELAAYKAKVASIENIESKMYDFFEFENVLVTMQALVDDAASSNKHYGVYVKKSDSCTNGEFSNEESYQFREGAFSLSKFIGFFLSSDNNFKVTVGEKKDSFGVEVIPKQQHFSVDADFLFRIDLLS